jgi:glutamate-1-semialdehyde aminotransferase
MNPYKIWNQAKKIIPGGNSLISKRPERFLPKYWPTYYKSSKGILITDINKKKYFDFAQMGYGTSTLGYCNKTIDNAVTKSIKNGILK